VIGNIPSQGAVLLFDDIEDLLKWTISGDGADYAGTKDTSVAFNKDASLKLITKATTPAVGDKVTALRDMPVPSSKRIEVTCFFRFDVQADTDLVQFELTYFDNTNQHVVRLVYDPVGEKWRYYNSSASTVDVTGGAQALLAGSFHRLRFIVDFSTDEYILLECDDLTVDMTGTACYTTAETTNKILRFAIRIQNELTNRAIAYFDDILVKEV